MNPAILTIVFLVVLGQLVSCDDQQQAALANASSAFAQRLHQKIARDQQSIVFSPYSIHSTLALTYLGARSQTAQEMSQLLNLQLLPGNQAHDAYHDLILKLNSVDNVALNLTSGVFLNANKSIEQDYKNDAENKYFAKVANFDWTYPGGPEKAINDWVSNQTEYLIKEVIPKGSIDAKTALILVNTFSFDGIWQDFFVESRTRKQDFNKPDGSKTQVLMMNDTRSILLKKDDDNRVDVAEVPYRGGRFSLYIVKPRDINGMSKLEDLLQTPGMPGELFHDLKPNLVQLGIPKFKIETKLDLKDKLKEMGLDKATTPQVADFTGISRDGDIFISKVIHNAFFDVHETGTSAAAVTALEGQVKKSLSDDVEDTFIADHPFLFFLWDNESNLILYQGKFSG